MSSLGTRYVANARRHTHTHTNACVWHCTLTKNKKEVWIGSPPAEKPLPGVPLAELSWVEWQELEETLKSIEAFFLSSFFFFCCWTFLPGSMKSQKWEMWALLFLFLMFHYHLCLRGGLKPTLFCASPYMVWCARATRVKQNSLITLQTLMQRCTAAGPVRGAQASQLCLTWAVQ